MGKILHIAVSSETLTTSSEVPDKTYWGSTQFS
jgi:hypothetical protein